MHGIQCNEVEFQNYSSLVNSWYILVHTGTYRYRRKPNSTLALEEELGACIPTVFKGNIVYIFCDAVRIWRDHDNLNGVLHTPQPLSTGITM